MEKSSEEEIPMLRPAVVLLSALLLAPAAFAGDDQVKTLDATVVDAKTAAAPGSGGATCTQGKHKRVVATTFVDTAKKAPCEVHYKKETEQPGHDQVIYTAANDISFCEAKAKAFVDKLAGMGWSCGQ
jgi:hypothetical protein